MIQFLIAQRLREKQAAEHRTVRWSEVAEVTGISRQVLANLASGRPRMVTNTAYVEALARYFRCGIERIIALDPPGDGDAPCHVDTLYPGRRRGGDRV